MIYILDGKTEEILGNIKDSFVIENEHLRSFEDNMETFDFTTFADKSFSEYLGDKNNIVIEGEDGEFIEFIIGNVRDFHDSGNRLNKEVYTTASYLMLVNAKRIQAQTTVAMTAMQHARSAIDNTEWEIGTIDFKGIRGITFENPTNPYTYLKRIASEFDLELRFRVEVKGSRIVGRYVDLVDRIGLWRGRVIEFERDLINLKRTIDYENIITALYGYGPVREDGTRLEVFVEDSEARERWGKRGRHIVDVYEPVTSDFEMTRDRLISLTTTELNKRINAVVTYETEIVDLENVPGLEHKEIRFGDMLRIKDKKFNPPLYLEARVFEMVRDIKVKGSKFIRLGDYQEFTEEEINALFSQLQKRLNLTVTMDELTEVTYPKNVIDAKDSNVYDNSIIFTEEYAEKKRVESVFPPSDKDVIWIDTSDSDHVVWKVWHNAVGDWVEGPSGPMGPQGELGPPGEDGKTLYTWIKYADDQYGNGMTDDPVGKPYLGMAYNKESLFESNNKNEYTWTKIEGDKGTEGPKGESGETLYTWMKYANDSLGDGLSDNPEGKEYIGLAYNKRSINESNNRNDYQWSKIRGEQGPQGERGLQGEQGPRGLQGLQGDTGKTGLQGPKGKDGQTQYTHIAYANNSNGTSGFSLSDSTNKLYIGMYVDFTEVDSNDPSRYNWTLIKGADGSQGIPGPKGTDGRTSYLHIAYANNSSGSSGFSISDSTNKMYIGQYTDFVQTDSTDYRRYSWTRIKGEQGNTGEQGPRGLQGLQGVKGDQGIKGDIGEVGATQYTHIAYATNSSGTTGFSLGDSTNKTYIGMYVDFSPSDSTNPASYRWTKIKGEEGEKGEQGARGATGSTGERGAKGDKGDTGNRGAQGLRGDQGIPGPKGTDGRTPYLHIAYSTNSTGTSGFSTTNSSGKTYIGQYTDYTASDSTDPSRYSWSLIKGTKGDKGDKGSTGSQGPRGPQGPNIVDSTTEIKANVIKANNIDFGTLSGHTINGITMNSSEFISEYEDSNNRYKTILDNTGFRNEWRSHYQPINDYSVVEVADGRIRFGGKEGGSTFTDSEIENRGIRSYGVYNIYATGGIQLSGSPVNIFNHLTIDGGNLTSKGDVISDNEIHWGNSVGRLGRNTSGWIFVWNDSNLNGIRIYDDDSRGHSIQLAGDTQIAGSLEVQGIVNMNHYRLDRVGAIYGRYSSGSYILYDHNNGNVSLNAMTGRLTLGHVNTNSVNIDTNLLTFSSGPSMDMAGGSARWRQSTVNYITQNTAGTIAFYANGKIFQVLNNGDLELGNNAIFVAKANHLYLRPYNTSYEVRVATGSGSYRPIRASSFPTSSSEKYKTNISRYMDNALNLINNSVVYKYNLIADLDGGMKKDKYGLIIERETPQEIIDEDGVDTYSMAALAWKAIQELNQKINDVNSLRNDVNGLKNQLNNINNTLREVMNSEGESTGD